MGQALRNDPLVGHACSVTYQSDALCHAGSVTYFCYFCFVTKPVLESAPMTDIALVTIVAFLLFMSSGLTGPIGSLYLQSLGAGYVAIGLLGTVSSMTVILFGYAWGRLSDRLGQRKMLMALGLVVLAAAHGLMAMAPEYRYLFPLRMLAAVAQAAYGTASLALTGDLLERHSKGRGRRMGVFRGMGSLGFGLMAFVSGSIADAWSLRAPYVMAAILQVLAFLVVLRVREPGPRSEPGPDRAHHPPAEAHPGRALPSDGQRRLPMAPLLISALLWSLVTGAVYAVWANYMVDEIGYSRTQMSRLWAIASLSEFPLMIVAGWLSDRVGRLPMLSLGFVAWAVVFLGYIVVPGMPWIVAIQLVRGFAYSAFTATAMTYATEVRARAQRGRASGLYESAGGLGSILGSSLGGSLTQFTSFRTMIGTNALVISAGAVYLAVTAAYHRAIGRRILEGPR